MAEHYKEFSFLDFCESMLPNASPRLARYERGLSEMVSQTYPDLRSRQGSPLPTRQMAIQAQRDLGADGVATAGGNLMPVALLNRGVELARQIDPIPFHELHLYRSSHQHVEAEARLIQALPAEQVVALFEQHCAKRLSP